MGEAYNRVNTIASNDASRKRPIPRESAVNVQVAGAQIVSEPLLSSEPSRFDARNARRRWRLQEGNGEFVARECGEKFLRPVQEYDPKSREHWGADAHPQPLTDARITQERANLRSDLATTTVKRSETLDRIYFWLAQYMELPEAERQKLEAEAHPQESEVRGAV